MILYVIRLLRKASSELCAIATAESAALAEPGAPVEFAESISGLVPRLRAEPRPPIRPFPPAPRLFTEGFETHSSKMLQSAYYGA
jgi:hypothetical protein